MKIIERMLGESIVIDENIVVSIQRCKDDEVRIGIDAPLSVAVHREEVYKKIQAGKKKPPVIIVKKKKGAAGFLRGRRNSK